MNDLLLYTTEDGRSQIKLRAKDQTVWLSQREMAQLFDVSTDDVLFINAAEHFVKGKRQNQLTEEHIAKMVATYQFRKEEPRYSKRVAMEEIAANDYNFNISRYISTAVAEEEIVLAATHAELVKIEKAIQKATTKHNEFLKELGLPPLP